MDFVNGLVGSFFWNRLMVNFLPGSLIVSGIVVNLYSVTEINEGIKTVGLVPCILFFVAICIIGVVAEELGALLEVKLFDRLAAGKMTEVDGDFHDHFIKYLCKPISSELPAKSFIRNLLIRYKFKLAMMPALFFLIICTVLLAGDGKINSVHALTTVLLLQGMIGLFYYQSYGAAIMLCRIRVEILKER